MDFVWLVLWGCLVAYFGYREANLSERVFRVLVVSSLILGLLIYLSYAK